MISLSWIMYFHYIFFFNIVYAISFLFLGINGFDI